MHQRIAQNAYAATRRYNQSACKPARHLPKELPDWRWLRRSLCCLVGVPVQEGLDVSVYEAEDLPGHYGYTNCDADDYLSEAEAVVAAVLANKEALGLAQ